MDGRYSNQELANFLDQLMMDINHAYSKLQLYVHFQNKIESRIDAINLAPAFFTLTMDSLFNDVIIKVCKIYDQKSYGTLNKLLMILESHSYLLSEDQSVIKEKIAIDRKDIKDKSRIINNLFTWRSKHYAHPDAKYFYDVTTLAKDAPLTYGELFDLLRSAAKIINKYTQLLTKEIYSLGAENTKDVDKILDILHEYLQNQ